MAYGWQDTCTHESLLDAGQLTANLEHRPGAQGRLPRGHRLPARADRRGASCASGAAPLAKTGCGHYLMGMLKEKVF